MILIMKVIKLSLVNVAIAVVLACYFVTDANDVILPDEKPCVCGQNLTLTCKLTEYTNTVSWMNDKDVIPIAKCVKSVCKTNPVYDDKFSLSTDLHERIFNLTILKVTMNDNGRQFVCSDGSNTESWRLTVKESEPMLIAEKENSITVLSGCYSQEVTFKWLKVDFDCESEFKPRKRQKNTIDCSSNSGCGYKAQAQYSETIYVKPSANGKYFLKSIMEYGNESLQSKRSSKRYTIDEMIDDPNVNTLPFYAQVLFFGAVEFGVLIIVVICLLIKSNKDHFLQFP